MLRFIVPVAAFVALVALTLGPSGARSDERIEQLSERLRTWLEDEVVYIISEREKEFLLELETMEEREAFVAAFWRRRDPDPLTEINEFREEHYRRIAYANRRLGGEETRRLGPQDLRIAAASAEAVAAANLTSAVSGR